MALFIGVTGTHSTGKSTFISELERQAVAQGIRVSTIADTATRCQDKGFKILLEHSFESTLWIIASVICAELEAALSAELILVDRPVSDALGYLEAALEMSDRRISPDQKEYLYKLVALHMNQYSLLFKTELDPTIPLGEGRDKNLEYRSKVDERISSTLKALNVKTVNPQADNYRMAVEAIFAEIKRLK